jgi:hypothetical protein
MHTGGIDQYDLTASLLALGGQVHDAEDAVPGGLRLWADDG